MSRTCRLIWAYHSHFYRAVRLPLLRETPSSKFRYETGDYAVLFFREPSSARQRGNPFGEKYESDKTRVRDADEIEEIEEREPETAAPEALIVVARYPEFRPSLPLMYPEVVRKRTTSVHTHCTLGLLYIAWRLLLENADSPLATALLSFPMDPTARWGFDGPRMMCFGDVVARSKMFARTDGQPLSDAILSFAAVARKPIEARSVRAAMHRCRPLFHAAVVEAPSTFIRIVYGVFDFFTCGLGGWGELPSS